MRLRPVVLAAAVLLVTAGCGASGPVLSVAAPGSASGSPSGHAANAASAEVSLDRVSLTPKGKAFPGGADRASISANGKHVAFVSPTQSWAFDHRDAKKDVPAAVYVRNLRTGKTVRVATCAKRAQNFAGGPAGCDRPRLSANGRYVVFTSDRALVPEDTDHAVDVFRTDLKTGTRIRVSGAADGTQTAGGGRNPSITADGATVAFASADALDPRYANPPVDPGTGAGPLFQVYVRDLDAGTLTLASVGTGVTGDVAGNGNSGLFGTEISADGAAVAFGTAADNFGPGVGNLAVKELASDEPAFLVSGRIGLSLPEQHYLSTESFSAPSAGGTRIAFKVDLDYGPDGDDPPSQNRGGVFVADLKAGRVIAAAENRAGKTLRRAFAPVLSADGNTLGFGYVNDGLLPADDNLCVDAFAMAVGSGKLTWLTRSLPGRKKPKGTNGCSAYPVDLSADGASVVLERRVSDYSGGTTRTSESVLVATVR